ncbi:hypothetical protein EDD11_008865 [Mortierella claussenii]|nr:hypothetical protein EDD11_008865 [Mortierella claussenii]
MKSRFVVITPHRTHADMMQKRLAKALKKQGFKDYQDCPSGVIAYDHLAVQCESLCGLEMNFYPENTILILDEISSLQKQICSDKTHGNMHNLNLQGFKRLIRQATRVICLDDDLCDEEVGIMKSLRSDFVITNNTFQQQKDDKVILFDFKMKLIAEALDLPRADKKLWVSSTMSAKCIEALHAMLNKAGFKGEWVTKNTEESRKRDISKNINSIMADLDYFIHSSIIGVGVDYNVKNHVDYVAGIFSTHSDVDVETSTQMVRRPRYVKSKTYLPQPQKLKTGSAIKSTLSQRKSEESHIEVTAGCIVKGKSDRLPKDNPITNDLKKEEEKISMAQHHSDEFERLSFGTQELSAAQPASVHKFALMRTYHIQEHSVMTDKCQATVVGNPLDGTPTRPYLRVICKWKPASSI